MGYMRLSQGPISLPALARAIEKGLAAELDGWQAQVADAELMKAPDGVSLLLRGVELRDRSGQPVMNVPRVGVSLSTWALLTGQVVPERVTLLSPRLRLRRGNDGALLVSVTETGGEDGGGQSSQGKSLEAGVERQSATASGQVLTGQQFDLTDLLESLFGSGRSGGYFKSIAARDASVVVDRESASPITLVLREAAVRLETAEERPVLVGHATVQRMRGEAEINVRVTSKDDGQGFSAEASFEGIDERMLSSAGFDLTAAANLGIALSGKARMDLTRQGGLENGDAALSVSWVLGPTDRVNEPLLSNSQRSGTAQINLDFTDGLQRVGLQPSTLTWAANSLTLTGTMEKRGSRWGLDVRSLEGWLQNGQSGSEPAPDRLVVDTFGVGGTFDLDAGIIDLDRGVLRAGGAESEFNGVINFRTTQATRLAFSVQKLPLEAVGPIWPPVVAPAARSWFLSNVKDSSPAEGWVIVDFSGGTPFGSAISAELAVADVNVSAFNGMPVMTFPAATLRMSGGTLEIKADAGRMPVPGHGEAVLTDARYTALGAMTADPQAEAAIKWSSDLEIALATLALPPLSMLPDDMKSLSARGTARADVRLVLPPPTPDWRQNVRVIGTARVEDGGLNGAALPYPVTGGTIDIALSERFADLKGNVLIGGVPAEVAWQRIYSAPEADQPPLRINATLDSTDRRQLGVGTGAFIQSGDTPVEVTVQKVAGGKLVHIDVDLTDTTLAVESLNWRKPPGQRSMLRFDVVDGQKFVRRLANLRVVGQGIALEGWAGLNERNELVHVELPTFSLGASRLSITGERRRPAGSRTSSDGKPIWHVDVKGSFYDGSGFFRSLFAAPGRTSDRTELGLELTAKIDSVRGFNDQRLTNFQLNLSKRDGEVSALKAFGRLDGGGSLDVTTVDRPGQPRRLVATSTDAGSVFRLVDFYPNARGGNMRLVVDMDGAGVAQRTGTLTVRNFEVLGDPVISEVIQTGEDGRPVIARGRRGQQRITREVIPFELMRAPFSVGHGQFVIQDAQLRGALFGASLRGKADYTRRTLELGGTYAPLQGLNAAFRVLPGIGEILTGPRGEGIVGMTFAVQGPMDSPEVLVNPLSLAAPGIFREIFQMSPLTPEITERAPEGRRTDDDGRPAISATSPVRRPETPASGLSKTPEKIIGDWTSETRSAPSNIFKRD